MFDVALKTALVSATLFVPGTKDLVPDTRCGIERAPAGVQTKHITWGDSLARVLQNAGVRRDEVGKIRRALRRHHDLNTLGVGDRIDLHVREDGAVSWFRFRPHLTNAICAKRTLRDAFVVRQEELEVRVRPALVVTAVPGTLAEAVDAAGEEASLALLIDDLFPLNVARSNDDENRRIRVLVEKRTIEGELLDYGRILAAEYRAKHKRVRVFHFEGGSGVGGYYVEDGTPRESTRLRSPIPGARIASGYGYRKHPIRRRRRMHRGIDYSGARGDAVGAAADGTVISANWEGPLGRMVAIRHADGLVTHYAHLSGFSERATRGKRVRQGQVIGYVGTSGLSTGAHLHFETLVDGKYMDPLRLAAAPAPELDPEELERFHEEVQRLLRLLDPAGLDDSDV